jgi:hypothetical protein
LPQKLTFEEVKNYFEKERYELLTNEYIKNSIKMPVRCPNGHEYETTYSNFKSGYRCKICAGVFISYEEVKSYIESYGYKLISDKYINAHKNLIIQCPQNHEFEISWNSFKNGNRCGYCSGNHRYTYDEVKETFKKENYELISKKYKNHTTKLKLRCPQGHEIRMTFSDFKNAGYRCTECSGHRKLRFEEVKSRIESEPNFILISKRYKNNTSLLKIKCLKHNHIFKQSLTDFESCKYKCPICAHENTTGENHYNWKGGISSERDMLKRGERYQGWRTKVLKRDNYTCQCCGEKNFLHVHHIRNFDERKDLRYVVSNGITLCERCHSPSIRGGFHYIYGTKNNNKKQINEYILKFGLRQTINNKTYLHNKIIN